jgi:hypothetical protein
MEEEEGDQSKSVNSLELDSTLHEKLAQKTTLCSGPWCLERRRSAQKFVHASYKVPKENVLFHRSSSSRAVIVFASSLQLSI